MTFDYPLCLTAIVFGVTLWVTARLFLSWWLSRGSRDARRPLLFGVAGLFGMGFTILFWLIRYGGAGL